ncbi:cryptochrome/photolyase family protein [Novipirellula artificiosorum]|uniref:Deoxyribodipyrimidine photo-lyase-related protein n=1 Tax=Novipirellula artificiosorum TaxID=2528016 RepID=A0A5C6D6I9_9BACT|nr:cryptochrome/photolyase family protein [Novipirellula artificiosorum]TWU31327.1 Deoxyribodipyrimidine photo-lyase-related protein [Novipirellula artificiosorum]
MILLIFPNQLFAKHPGLKLDPSRVILLEDSLYFGDKQYPMQMHKQKLWFHRATMKRYACDLCDQGFEVQYVEHDAKKPMLSDQLQKLIRTQHHKGTKLCVVDPTDFALEKRLRKASEELGIDCEFLPNPGFINSQAENQEYRQGKRRWFMADFYKWQRRRLDILMDGDEPRGGQWSFDEENRKKLPKKQLATIPANLLIKRDDIDDEAKAYVEKRFPDNPGYLKDLIYPTSHREARRWLDHFLANRLEQFGAFEDAIVEGESWLWHSVLTPVMNTGLLTPDEVIKETLRFAKRNEVPLNSLEGFVRQIIGWREFMRATYQDLGVAMRTTNHWQHHRAMPKSFYNGTTGIAPIDDTIHRVLETGYCHHIERLMVLGGFMFLCEINPNDIYRWFMEMFIDSYDWVMVPNVYAMSQNADGGAITTKPYFSGSSYIRKMSHYKKESWCDVWDGLYWRWIWNHADDLRKNPRWAMMCSMATKMDSEKREQHLRTANAFLGRMQ